MKRITLLSIALIFFTVSVSYAGTLSNRPVSGSELGYTYSETVSSTATGDTIVIPPLKLGNKPVTITLIAGGNTGHIEFSTSADSLIAAGSGIFQTWPKGVISDTQSDVILGPITAVRCISDLGEVKYEIVY